MAWGRSAGRPSLFPFGVSVILKSDSDMTKEEAKERFGDNIINKLLSLGAEPTIDTGWVNRIFKHLPEKAWDNTIINMNICVEYGTGDLWYSRVRTFEGSCCAEYILTSRKPRKNNRRELVNNPEDQLLGFDTVRETVFGMKKELNIDESINVKFDYEIIGGS